MRIEANTFSPRPHSRIKEIDALHQLRFNRREAVSLITATATASAIAATGIGTALDRTAQNDLDKLNTPSPSLPKQDESQEASKQTLLRQRRYGRRMQAGGIGTLLVEATVVGIAIWRENRD